MIPLRTAIPVTAPVRGYARLSGCDAEHALGHATKPNSLLWIRHDGKVFEELRPVAGDLILVCTDPALRFPATHNSFRDAYHVVTPLQQIPDNCGPEVVDSTPVTVLPLPRKVMPSEDASD